MEVVSMVTVVVLVAVSGVLGFAMGFSVGELVVYGRWLRSLDDQAKSGGTPTLPGDEWKDA